MRMRIPAALSFWAVANVPRMNVLMARPWRIAGALLLAAYGAIALLGHGGMHAVQDLSGVAHSHGGCVAAHGHEAAHPHQHACGHHHHHGPEHGGGPHAHEPAPLPGSVHDHDNREICHHFAAGALIEVAAPAVSGEEGSAFLSASAPVLLRGSDEFTLPIRGPPAGDC